ncbi:MAG: hypothetical protein AAF690_12295 [Acidobacteriota bacterium]
MSSQIDVKVVAQGVLEVVADSFGGFIDSFSDRLSHDGVLLPGAPPLERGQQVELRFALEDGFVVLQAMGLVAEPKRDGLGVHFLAVQSGEDLLDKIEQDRTAAGQAPFRVDEAAALPATPELPSEPPPAEQEAPADAPESSEVDPEPNKVAGLLDEETAPAFAPGMDRLQNEAVHERKALNEIGAGFSGSQDPLAEIGGQKSVDMPSTPPDTAPESEVQPSALLEGDAAAARLDSSAAAELSAAESAMAAEPAAAEEAGVTDLGQLSDEDFADEIDDVLDSAFGPSMTETSPSEFADEAATQFIPTLAEADVAELGRESSVEPQASSAAEEVADLLGGPASEATELLEAEGLLPTTEPELEDEDLVPEPPPQLGRLDELSPPVDDDPQIADEPLLAAAEPESSSDDVESAPVDAAEPLAEEAPVEAMEPPQESVSQLEMPAFESFDLDEPPPQRQSFLRGIIPLLLLALIGVGAWRVADLVRKEFSRLEEEQTPAARVPLAEDADVLEAPADSLLALRRQEDGPAVDLELDPTLAPANLLENVTWSESDGSTVVDFAGNGSLSPADTSLLRLDGESPRYVLKIGGMSEAYFANQLPLRTAAVDQLRFGLHLGTLRNEVHVVFDLTGADVEVRQIQLEPRRLRVILR